MAADIKTISDALISRLASQVSSLNRRTVATFGGGIGNFFTDKRVKNLPFVGVQVRRVGYEGYNSDNSVCVESLEIDLLLVIKDMRDQGFGKEAGYELIDKVRDALMGQTLGIQELVPIEIEGFEDSEDLEEFGLYGFTGKIKTSHIRGG